MPLYFENSSYSYFAFKSTHFAQVLEHFAQTCICTFATFRSSDQKVVPVNTKKNTKHKPQRTTSKTQKQIKNQKPQNTKLKSQSQNTKYKKERKITLKNTKK